MLLDSFPESDDDFDPLGPPDTGLRARIDALVDATGGSLRAAFVALGILVAVGGVVWWSLRPPPTDVDAAIPLVVVPTTTTTEPTAVVVHVAGAVVRPGVYTLPAGARLIDAVDAAGGPLAGADLGRVNLAAAAVDGGQLYVPAVGEAPPALVGADGASPAGGGPLDLNTATAAELESLPGVGPATAAAIVDHRERHGPFATVEALLDVRGIGEAKLAALRDRVRV